MKRLIILLIMLLAVPCGAVDLWVDVDTAIVIPVNLMALTADGTTVDAGVTYDEAGMVLTWHFYPTDGTYSQDIFDPCNTGGDYDWVADGNGMYTIGMPASGGSDMNNDTAGQGWITGVSTANFLWRGPIMGFRAVVKNNLEIDDATAQANQSDTYDGTGYAGGTIVSQADVTKWLGTAVATPTTAGVPEVDVTFVDGSAVPVSTATFLSDALSSSDLKDNLRFVFKTAIDGDPNTGSVWERLKTIDDAYTAARAVFLDNINGHTAQTGDTYALANDGTSGFVALESLVDDIGVAGAGLTNINLPNQTMDITGSLSGSVGSVTGHTNQTGDSYAVVNSGTFGLSVIEAQTDDIGTAGAGLTAINLPNQTMDIVGNITGNLSGSVGSVSGAVGSVTADVGIDAGAVDDIWDEVLSGGTHNVSNSAGKRLRQIQENLGYQDGAVWIDTVNGAAGTANFENGTVGNPVNSIADALTLAGSLGLVRFQVVSNSSITLAAAVDGYLMIGTNWTLALGGQSISGSYIKGADITGIGTGASEIAFVHCHFGNVTLPPSDCDNCVLEGTFTIGTAGDFFFENCKSGVAGTSTPVIDFGSALNSSNLNMRSYSGGIEIQNMGAGTGSYNMSLEGDGQLIINANCSATSTVAIRGNFTVTDNASGAVTLSDNARYDVDQVTDAIWDVDPTDHEGTDTFGALAKDVNDSVGGASAADVWTYGTRVLTANTNLNDPSAVENVAALMADTGFTAGGTWTFEEFLKFSATWMLGDWYDKVGDTSTQQILDPDDGTTIILEIVPSDVSPYKTVTIVE